MGLYLGKTLRYLRQHWIVSIIVATLVVFTGYQYFKNGNVAPTIVVAARTTVTQEVSVTGNVKPAKSVDLAFEQSGKISKVNIRVGDHVDAGASLIELDDSSLSSDLKQAQASLASAELSLDKSKLQYEQLLRGDALNKDYEDGLVILTGFYDEFSVMLDGANKIFFGHDFNNSANKTNIEYYADYNSAFAPVPARIRDLYQEVQSMYGHSILDYQNAKRGGGDRDWAIESGYELLVKTAEMIKTGRDVVRYLQNFLITTNTVHLQATLINSHVATLTDYTNSVDGYLKNLINVRNSIQSEKDALNTNPLDLESRQVAVDEARAALDKIKSQLAKTVLAAPFAGVITKFDLSPGELVTASVPVVTLISNARFEIEAYVPEADVAKLKIGNKAKVTLDAYGSSVVFDAEVMTIDPAETVIEGVANYKTTLAFVADDARLKSGMTANVDVLTDRHENVIAVPQRVIVTKEDGSRYVLLWDGKKSQEAVVETGLRGADGNTEVVSGVREGDKIAVP